jgi:MEMO1 family protein
MKTSLGSIDRNPAVAGQFYAAKPEKLQHELQEIFAKAVPKKHEHVRAIISPHAGYIFSGTVAASAFNQIDGDKTFRRIFILASSHHENLQGGSVYCDGDYKMPFGTVKVDTEFCKGLVEKHPKLFTSNPRAHLHEHSLEVQLPFLNFVMETEYRIVPIILGAPDQEICEAIADVLKPHFNDRNLFIISSDFSHFPDYTDAKQVDLETKDAILTNDPDELRNVLRAHSHAHIPGLVTSLCGWTSVLTLLYITANDPTYEYHAITYLNSGDTPHFEDMERVVGYWAIAVCERKGADRSHVVTKIKSKNTEHSDKTTSSAGFHLSETEKTTLLELARKSISTKIRLGQTLVLNADDYPDTLKVHCGAFVTLHQHGRLRGCIGRLIGDIPLAKMIREMAISSAMHDPRFAPLTAEELSSIDIEISVLSPLKKITDSSEIELGKHGILLRKGPFSGIFLPQVATETGWSVDEFLGHCARDKAGMTWDGWKTAELFVFTAEVFSETPNKTDRE